MPTVGVIRISANNITNRSSPACALGFNVAKDNPSGLTELIIDMWLTETLSGGKVANWISGWQMASSNGA
jgi:hypothetical protein